MMRRRASTAAAATTEDAPASNPNRVQAQTRNHNVRQKSE